MNTFVNYITGRNEKISNNSTLKAKTNIIIVDNENDIEPIIKVSKFNKNINY